MLPPGAPIELRGAQAVAEQTVLLSERARLADLALINGHVGLVLAPHGQLQLAVTITVSHQQISAYEVIADPAKLQRLNLAVLES